MMETLYRIVGKFIYDMLYHTGEELRTQLSLYKLICIANQVIIRQRWMEKTTGPSAMAHLDNPVAHPSGLNSFQHHPPSQHHQCMVFLCLRRFFT